MNQRVLISCLNKNGGLYCLNPESGFVFQVHDFPGRGLCMLGEDGKIAQAVNDRNIMTFRFHNGRWGNHRDFFRIVPYPDPSDIHDLFYDGESLWCAQTARDCIYKLDHEFKIQRTIGISPFVQDTIHWNTIWIDSKTREIYGCAFCSPGKKWRSEELDGGIFFRFSDDEINAFKNITPLHTPHTLKIDDTEATICNSMTGEFLICKIASDRKWHIAEKHFIGNGYLRGSARYGNGWLLGLSTPRGKSDIPARVAYMDQYGCVMQSWEIPAYDIYDLLIV